MRNTCHRATYLGERSEDVTAIGRARQVDEHDLVESARAEDGGVNDVRPIRSRHDEHLLALVEAVHHRQQLVDHQRARFLQTQSVPVHFSSSVLCTRT